MKEIVIYMQPGIDLEVKDNQFYSRDNLDISTLTRGLGKYDIKLNKLGSNTETDDFNADRAHQIFYLKTSENAEAIRDFLITQTKFVQSAYIKADAETPGTGG